MKKIFLFLAFYMVLFFGCKKDHNNSSDCTTVTIVGDPLGACPGIWSIRTNDIIYQSNNIPDKFKQNELKVCARFELYQDTGLCPCCGGTWADIKFMENQ